MRKLTLVDVIRKMIILRNKCFTDKIGGIYRFAPDTKDQDIIEHILHDFCLKLYGIMKLYYSPKVGCSSLCTYEIFKKWWEIEDPGDVSHDGEEIYSEIPSDWCAAEIENISGGTITKDEVKRSFSGGEFPILKIWKGYHEGRDEIHATYAIMR